MPDRAAAERRSSVAVLLGGVTRLARVLAARALEGLAVVAALASLVFFALRLLPGDPARLVLGDEASPADLARVRATLHLDEPLLTQYARFLRGLATLDLGDSFRRPGTSAMAQVGEALVPTSGAGAGGRDAGGGSWAWRLRSRRAGRGFRGERGRGSSAAWSGWRRRRWWLSLRCSRGCSPRACASCRCPGDPDAGLAGLLFASALLALPLARARGSHRAGCAGRGRARAVPVGGERQGGAARCGCGACTRCRRSSVRSSRSVATQLGALLGGAVVLERMFERRGLGTLMLEAYSTRDLPVLEGAVVAAGLLFVAAQALGTLVHLAIDPRARAAA